MRSVPHRGSIFRRLTAAHGRTSIASSRMLETHARSPLMSGALLLAALLFASHAGLAQSASLGAQPVGTTGGEQNVTVKAGAAGTVATVGIFTQGIGADTVKRLANPTISRVVKQRLLDLAGAALGMMGSSTVGGGVVKDTAVWIVTQPATRP